MKVKMLTTIDNPFDPFEQFDEWNAFDVQQGYHTNAYLARIVAYSDELSDDEKATAIDQAMDEIMQFNISGQYKVITKEVDD